jgi:hypothetical protein
MLMPLYLVYPTSFRFSTKSDDRKSELKADYGYARLLATFSATPAKFDSSCNGGDPE